MVTQSRAGAIDGTTACGQKPAHEMRLPVFRTQNNELRLSMILILLHDVSTHDDCNSSRSTNSCRCVEVGQVGCAGVSSMVTSDVSPLANICIREAPR
jgi:hypothetical protein